MSVVAAAIDRANSKGYMACDGLRIVDGGLIDGTHIKKIKKVEGKDFSPFLVGHVGDAAQGDW